jgi:hypothetical protein
MTSCAEKYGADQVDLLEVLAKRNFFSFLDTILKILIIEIISKPEASVVNYTNIL